jgi:branched-chain amino acid transport system substrate-binding protein/neutral amino acid transport system substrate-binding protein
LDKNWTTLHPTYNYNSTQPQTMQNPIPPIAATVLTLLIFTTACKTPNGSENPPEDKTGGLKIGTLLPITGDLAQYGAPMQDSAALLVEKVNACEGVLQKPVELVTADDQTEPSRGAAAMTKLAEVDRVAGVIGAASSAVSTVAIEVAVRNQIVQISPASTSPTFTERAQKGDFQGFWFRTAPSDALQGPALAQLAQSKGFKSVAVLAINNDYGNGLSKAFIEAFKGSGGTIADDAATLYPPDGAAFDAEVTAAFANKPDAVLLIAYPETGSLVLRAAFEKGYLDGKTQLLFTEGMKAEKLAELVGKDASGRFIVAGALGTAPKSGGPGYEAFLADYEKAYNRKPEVFDANTWDAAALLILAAQAGGDTTGPVLKENILKVANPPGDEVSDVCQALAFLREGVEINYQGASSEIQLDQWGDVAGSYDLWTVTDQGELKVINTLSVGGAASEASSGTQ